MDTSTRPELSNASRPVSLNYLRSIEVACKTGFLESRKLGTEDEKSYKITFTSWLSAIRVYFEDCGMDSIFRIIVDEE